MNLELPSPVPSFNDFDPNLICQEATDMLELHYSYLLGNYDHLSMPQILTMVELIQTQTLLLNHLSCGHQFVLYPQTELTERLKGLIDKLLLTLLTLAEISHVTGVSERWLRSYTNEVE